MPVERTVVFPGPASPGLTLAPQRRGPGDPCYQLDADRAIWRTSLQPSGAVTARISRSAPDAVTCQAWGEGAEEFLEALPALLGADDDAERLPAGAPGHRGRGQAGAAPAAGAHRTRPRGVDPRGDRAAGAGRRRVPGVAAAGHQVRQARARARSRPDAGAAVGAGVAADPVLGVPPRQRRPGPRPHRRRLCPAGRRAGTAGRPAGRRSPRGADRASRCRRVDGGRDSAAGLR